MVQPAGALVVDDGLGRATSIAPTAPVRCFARQVAVPATPCPTAGVSEPATRECGKVVTVADPERVCTRVMARLIGSAEPEDDVALLVVQRQ
jgi:hypothetical protein